MNLSALDADRREQISQALSRVASSSHDKMLASAVSHGDLDGGYARLKELNLDDQDDGGITIVEIINISQS